jgi:hypothetical protein
VLLSHADLCRAEDYEEISKLLNFDKGTYILKEFDKIAGHGGVEAVPAGEVSSIGKSIVRNS